MYLRRLSLTNVRQFAAKTLSFQPGFNLLVGENGAGKTGTLRAISATLARSPHTQWRMQDEDIRLGSTNLAIEAVLASSAGDIISTSTYARQLYQRPTRRRAPEAPRVLAYMSNEATCGSFVSRRARRIDGDDADARRSSEGWLFDRELRQRDEAASRTRFGRSQDVRRFVRAILNRFSPNFRDFAWSFEPFSALALVDGNPEMKAAPSSKFRRALENSVLRYLRSTKINPLAGVDSPWVIVRADGLLRGTGKRERIMPAFPELLSWMRAPIDDAEPLDNWAVKIRLTPRIRVRHRSGTTFLLNQLSDGEQRLFSLFVDIARQLSLEAPDAARLADVPAIVLIDEIDVHLHPKWQRMVVPMLEDLFPACQFIATTHSPFVVQAVAESKVQHLDGKKMGSFRDRGIEEIAVKVMGIEHPEVSKRYLEMLDAAREYFSVLGQTKEANPRRRTELKNRLNDLSRRYADNPAYQAFLELHGQLELGPDELR